MNFFLNYTLNFCFSDKVVFNEIAKLRNSIVSETELTSEILDARKKYIGKGIDSKEKLDSIEDTVKSGDKTLINNLTLSLETMTFAQIFNGKFLDDFGYAATDKLCKKKYNLRKYEFVDIVLRSN